MLRRAWRYNEGPFLDPACGSYLSLPLTTTTIFFRSYHVIYRNFREPTAMIVLVVEARPPSACPDRTRLTFSRLRDTPKTCTKRVLAASSGNCGGLL